MTNQSTQLVTSSIPPQRDGFIAVPQPVMEWLLCLNLTQRELVVLLLVARLTYGCRNGTWATLRQADLMAVGIGANHAKEALARLLKRGLLIQEGSDANYRLGNPSADDAEDMTERQAQLARLVSRKLSESSRFRKVVVPQSGTEAFPNREEKPSILGNPSTGVTWSFSRSEGQFVKKNTSRIDRDT